MVERRVERAERWGCGGVKPVIETTTLRRVEIRESGRRLLVERTDRDGRVLKTEVRCPNSLRVLNGGELARRAIRAAFPPADREPERVEHWTDR